ncbi:MAG: cyclic nucleotide-binding domain-containing protein [Chloroflexota bacterium]
MVSPELLRRYAFFADFSYQEIKALAVAGEEKMVDTGQLLFAEGAAAEHLYFLIDGEVEILLEVNEGQARHVPLSTIPPGELIGWSALVEPRLFTASARATRPSRLIAFNAVGLEQDMVGQPHLCNLLLRKVVQVLSHRLKDTRIQLLSLAMPSTGG